MNCKTAGKYHNFPQNKQKVLFYQYCLCRLYDDGWLLNVLDCVHAVRIPFVLTQMSWQLGFLRRGKVDRDVHMDQQNSLSVLCWTLAPCSCVARWPRPVVCVCMRIRETRNPSLMHTNTDCVPLSASLLWSRLSRRQC